MYQLKDRSLYLIGAATTLALAPAILQEQPIVNAETFQKTVTTSGGGPGGSGYASVNETNGTNLDGTASHILTGTGSGSLPCAWHSYSFLSGFTPSMWHQVPYYTPSSNDTLNGTEYGPGNIPAAAQIVFSVTDTMNYSGVETIHDGY